MVLLAEGFYFYLLSHHHIMFCRLAAPFRHCCFQLLLSLSCFCSLVLLYPPLLTESVNCNLFLSFTLPPSLCVQTQLLVFIFPNMFYPILLPLFIYCSCVFCAESLHYSLCHNSTLFILLYIHI